MKMIENLFYGNICPCEKVLTRGSENYRLLQLAAKNEEKLYSILSPQQTEQFEKLKECIIDMNNISEKESLILQGFSFSGRKLYLALYDLL